MLALAPATLKKYKTCLIIHIALKFKWIEEKLFQLYVEHIPKFSNEN